MPIYKGADEGADSEGSSLAGVLAMFQEQHQSQEKMLLDMIEQRRLLAHEKEMKALKNAQPSKDISDSLKVKLPKPILQKLTAMDHVEHF